MRRRPSPSLVRQMPPRRRNLHQLPSPLTPPLRAKCRWPSRLVETSPCPPNPCLPSNRFRRPHIRPQHQRPLPLLILRPGCRPCRIQLPKRRRRFGTFALHRAANLAPQPAISCSNGSTKAAWRPIHSFGGKVGLIGGPPAKLFPNLAAEAGRERAGPHKPRPIRPKKRKKVNFSKRAVA